jgi:hypothetical protein
MKAVPLNEETAAVAKRIIWFEPPSKALSDPCRLMAYAMAHATHEEMRVLRRYVSDEDIRDALDHAPPGIVDSRSWAYWNSKMGHYPPPPLSVRRFGNIVGPSKLEFVQSRESADPVAARKPGLEEERRNARVAWKKMRQHRSSEESLEEIRRRAREEWRTKYGPGKEES